MEQVFSDELVTDPVAELRLLKPKRNPKIILPQDVVSVPNGVNSARVRPVGSARSKGLCSSACTIWKAGAGAPGLNAWKRAGGGEVTSPHDRRIEVGKKLSFEASARRCGPDRPCWAMLRRSTGTHSGAKGALRLLDRAADLYEEHREEFYSLCIREACKNASDAVSLKTREARRFPSLLRVRSTPAVHASSSASRPSPASSNELRLHGRGVFACISPWNFPLAIFTGLVVGRARCRQCRHCQASRQTPLIGVAGRRR